MIDISFVNGISDKCSLVEGGFTEFRMQAGLKARWEAA